MHVDRGKKILVGSAACCDGALGHGRGSLWSHISVTSISWVMDVYEEAVLDAMIESRANVLIDGVERMRDEMEAGLHHDIYVHLHARTGIKKTPYSTLHPLKSALQAPNHFAAGTAYSLCHILTTSIPMEYMTRLNIAGDRLRSLAKIVIVGTAYGSMRVYRMSTCYELRYY